jgi:peptidoglycan/LPS O-acetylase OafA/YrhL
MDALFLGVLGAWALSEPALLNTLRRSLGAIRSVVVAAAAVTAVLLVTNQGIASLGMSLAGHTVIAFGSLGIIFLARLSRDGATQRFFRQGWLVWLGTVSYGIYLLHQPVSGLVHGVLRRQPPQMNTASDMLVTLLASACTLALAAISWTYLERPIVAIGRRIGYGKPADIVAVA